MQKNNTQQTLPEPGSRKKNRSNLSSDSSLHTLGLSSSSDDEVNNSSGGSQNSSPGRNNVTRKSQGSIQETPGHQDGNIVDNRDNRDNRASRNNGGNGCFCGLFTLFSVRREDDSLNKKRLTRGKKLGTGITPVPSPDK